MTYFEIGLSFSDKPEKLTVPFAAVRGFYDPSVNFELEFDVALAEGEEEGAEITAYPVADMATATAVSDETTDGEPKPPGSVVSLDAFRKKN